MGETLTRLDFQPILPPPLMRSGWKVPEAQPTSPFATKIAVSNPFPGVSVSPNSALVSVIMEQQSTYQSSPAALTGRLTAVRFEEFRQSFNEAIDLSNAMTTEDEAAPLNIQTWTYAARELISLLLAFDVRLPLILPLQNGGIGVEWHERGLNIELRFRKPYQVYVVLEDARNVIPTLHDYDANFVQLRAALGELASR
jgi:hypothetical protein